jgi:peptidoglycan/LPS O-acetylase OafA/YrhL
VTARLAHQPALDGLRGVAVTMVLLFHGGVSWMRGGYVGVSVFFTLSGYLITSILLAEHDETGGIRLGRFAARRARRLLPASALCLTGVLACSALGLLDGVAHLRRDMFGAVMQVQNWVLLLSGESYTDLLTRVGGRPSPLEHYWSLAIEEQFYWIWPLTLGVLAVIVRRRRATAVGALAVGFAVIAPVVAARWGADGAYWATPARLPEILFGAWLAVVLRRRPPTHRAWGVAAIMSLAIVVGAAASLPAGGGPAYRGGLAVFALVTTALLASLQVDGPVRRMLSWRPIVAVGAVSYGLYLFHWPVYVVLDRPRTGLDGPALLVLRLVVTALIAVVSFVVVEQPVRQAAWAPGPTLAGAFGGTVVLILAVAVVVPVSSPEYWHVASASVVTAAPPPADAAAPLVAAIGPRPTIEPVGVSRETGSIVPSPSSSAAPSTSPAEPVVAQATAGTATPALRPARPVRVVVVGDSTAEALGAGLLAWAAADPALADVALAVSPGCGFVRGGIVPTDGDVPFGPRCDEVLDVELPQLLAERQPDVVVLLATSRDTVVWVRPPDVDPYWLGEDDRFSDPANRAAVEAVMVATAKRHPGATVLDFRSWTVSDGIAADHAARPDGVHWTPSAATDIATRWFGPELVRLALEHAAAAPFDVSTNSTASSSEPP